MKYIGIDNKEFSENDSRNILKAFDDRCILLENAVRNVIIPMIVYTGSKDYRSRFDYYFMFDGQLALIKSIDVVEGCDFYNNNTLKYISDSKIFYSHKNNNWDTSNINVLNSNIIDCKETKLFKHIKSIYDEVIKDIELYKLLLSLK